MMLAFVDRDEAVIDRANVQLEVSFDHLKAVPILGTTVSLAYLKQATTVSLASL
jgi:hypothetical protein